MLAGLFVQHSCRLRRCSLSALFGVVTRISLGALFGVVARISLGALFGVVARMVEEGFRPAVLAGCEMSCVCSPLTGEPLQMLGPLSVHAGPSALSAGDTTLRVNLGDVSE